VWFGFWGFFGVFWRCFVEDIWFFGSFGCFVGTLRGFVGTFWGFVGTFRGFVGTFGGLLGFLGVFALLANAGGDDDSAPGLWLQVCSDFFLFCAFSVELRGTFFNLSISASLLLVN